MVRMQTVTSRQISTNGVNELNARQDKIPFMKKKRGQNSDTVGNSKW